MLYLLFFDNKYEMEDCISSSVRHFRSSAEGDPVEGKLPGGRDRPERGPPFRPWGVGMGLRVYLRKSA